MLCDAHVHMGYYSRVGWREPFYYSPRRVFGVLNRCGVDEFIVSSTCAQIAEIDIMDIVREAQEMKRLAGQRAHVFFWLSGHLYDEDREMGWLHSGIFEGIKLHEGETQWMKNRKADLQKVLAIAEKHNLPIVFHAGEGVGSRPFELAKIAQRHPAIRFSFAHCRPMDEMAVVIAKCPNVWTDTAYMDFDEFPRLRDYDWRGRLMFGTDLPVWQTHVQYSLSRRYREYVHALRLSGFSGSADKGFCDYLKTNLELPPQTEKNVWEWEPSCRD